MVYNNNDAVRDLLLKYTLDQYPYSDSNWSSIEVELDRQEHDQPIVMHFFKESGLLTDQGEWDRDLTDFGLFQVISYLEADRATGFSQRLTKTIVSDRGSNFISEFLDLFNGPIS